MPLDDGHLCWKHAAGSICKNGLLITQTDGPYVMTNSNFTSLLQKKERKDKPQLDGLGFVNLT